MVEPQLKIELEGVPSLDPIATLNRLISERSNQLRQSVFQATAAVAVNALKSIRSATNDARKRKKFNIKVEETTYCVGFSFTDKKPCLRASRDKHSQKVKLDARVVFLTKGIKNPSKHCHVYKVTYEKESIKPIYIACLSPKNAMDFALRATKHRIDAKGTLAKNALGVAIGRVASQSLGLEGSTKSRQIASQLATVTENKSGDNYTLRIQDNLDYASNALKGGESAIDIALQKAANKTYGTLAHLGGLDFKEKFPQKPFPEVK